MGRTTDATGKPTYQPTPTETVADLQAAVDYADKIGGLLKLTSAERTSLTADQTKPGWIISEVDTGFVYLVTASQPQGRMISGDTGDQPITLFGGWSVHSGPAPTYRVRNGMVSLNGRISAGAGATGDAFQLPPVARPSAQRVSIVGRPSNVTEAAIINSNGVVTFSDLVTLPAVDYRLGTIPSWPAVS